jgi:hypothetical protein
MDAEKGQTLLEVTFLLPFLLLFVILLYKIMIASQMSIVNSQYARSQVYVLLSNNSDYPRIYFRKLPSMFIAKDQDRMILGVADPKAASPDTSIEPMPQLYSISRKGTSVPGSNDTGEVKLRTEVRVRNTSGICTQLNDLPNGSNKRWPFGGEVCQYKGIK